YGLGQVLGVLGRQAIAPRREMQGGLADRSQKAVPGGLVPVQTGDHQFFDALAQCCTEPIESAAHRVSSKTTMPSAGLIDMRDLRWAVMAHPGRRRSWPPSDWKLCRAETG